MNPAKLLKGYVYCRYCGVEVKEQDTFIGTTGNRRHRECGEQTASRPRTVRKANNRQKWRPLIESDSRPREW